MTFVQTQFSRKIKTFQSDGGTEFVNHNVRSLFEANGMFHRLSWPYTPQQNGRAERKHRHIVETGLAMIFNSRIPNAYWVDAFSSAVYIINRLPTKVLDGKSPFELLFSQVPHYSNFRAYGCLVFPYLRDYSENKLAPRSLLCVFIGYSSQYKGYQCLDPISKRIYVTRHARFDEASFPFSGNRSTSDLSNIHITSFLDDSSSPSVSPAAPIVKNTLSDTSVPLGCSSCLDPLTSLQIGSASVTSTGPVYIEESVSSVPLINQDQPVSNPTSEPAIADLAPTPATIFENTLPVHPMITRARAGIFKPRHQVDLAHLDAHCLYSAPFASHDPKGFKLASKNRKWMLAMHEEIDAF